jgi:hypothetical protein
MSATWFRCDPSKLIGALSGMAPDHGYVYTMVLLRIYEVGGPVDDDEHVLARRTGHTVKKVSEAIQWLVARDKIQRLENGLLDSRTTHEELAYREKLIKDAQNAGNSSVKKRASVSFKKDKQNQQIDPTPVERPLNGAPAVVERPSTDIEVDIEIEKKEVRDLKVSCPKSLRTKKNYSEKFEEFWRVYPTDANMGKHEAFVEWQKLSPEDQDAAVASCQPFRSYCSSHPDYRPIHAGRYLAKRRFDGHEQTAKAVSQQVFVRVGSPQWESWERWYRKTKNMSPPTNKEGTGWSFPFEWPADMPARVHA